MAGRVNQRPSPCHLQPLEQKPIAQNNQNPAKSALYNVFSGCLIACNRSITRFTALIARRNFQRVGAKITQSSIYRTEKGSGESGIITYYLKLKAIASSVVQKSGFSTTYI